MKLRLLLSSLVFILVLGACVPVQTGPAPEILRNDPKGPYWNPVIVVSGYSSFVELNWHPINPPHPGLACWAAEIEYHSGGYAGYGYSYVYCEPSS